MLYNLHSPKDKFYGYDEPKSLEDIKICAQIYGLGMTECFIPDGLNSYEESHPNKAVIFDVSSEDVVMVEKD